MSAPPPPPKGGGMSLYANLLNPKADSSASISGAPVLYDNGNKDDAAAKKDANPGMSRRAAIGASRELRATLSSPDLRLARRP